MARTHRSPDGAFASTGAVSQTGGSLPIYVCNECNRDVVWAESQRTGKKYLANVFRGYRDQRFYVAARLHKCTDDAEWAATYASATDAVLDRDPDLAVALDDAAADEYDDFKAEQYDAHVASAVRTAYAARTKHGETERGSYYETSKYIFTVESVVVDEQAVRRVLAAGDGQSMASYGSFSNYSTVGRVEAIAPDTFVVESVYHIGD